MKNKREQKERLICETEGRYVYTWRERVYQTRQKQAFIPGNMDTYISENIHANIHTWKQYTEL